MDKRYDLNLSRRERQIMEIIYRKGDASVADVLRAMSDPPSYSAVRAIMNILEEKGQLKHREAGRKYIYSPRLTPEKARQSALQNILHTFFEGSVEQAVASLLDVHGDKLSDKDLKRLSILIERARKEGR